MSHHATGQKTQLSVSFWRAPIITKRHSPLLSTKPARHLQMVVRSTVCFMQLKFRVFGFFYTFIFSLSFMSTACSHFCQTDIFGISFNAIFNSFTIWPLCQTAFFIQCLFCLLCEPTPCVKTRKRAIKISAPITTLMSVAISISSSDKKFISMKK